MSFMTKLKSIPSHAPHGIAPQHGIKGMIYDKGERAVMAGLLGAAKGYYYDRAVFRGIDLEAWVGVLGYLGSAFLGGNKHLERAGDVGMTAYIYSRAASWGADRAGRSVQVSKQMGGKKQVVGVIPPKKDGPFLTADDIANYAQPR